MPGKMILVDVLADLREICGFDRKTALDLADQAFTHGTAQALGPDGLTITVTYTHGCYRWTAS